MMRSIVSTSIVLAGLSASASAHDLDLARVEIRRNADGTVVIEVAVSPPAAVAPPIPELTDEYEFIGADVVGRGGDSFRYRYACESVSQRLGNVRLPWSHSRVYVVVRDLDAILDERLLAGSATGFVVPNVSFKPDQPPPTVGDFLWIGVEHILFGPDHLLFVLGLLVLVDGPRRLFATITAFTVAHCITLTLVTLGVLSLPAAAIESLIALSLVLLGVEIVRAQRGNPGLTCRHPWFVVFGFGLLHGLGFANALSELGLPQERLPVALFLFNLGIELGQLFFVAVFLAVVWAARRTSMSWPNWAKLVPAYAIGGLAMFWFVERAAAMFTPQ